MTKTLIEARTILQKALVHREQMAFGGARALRMLTELGLLAGPRGTRLCWTLTEAGIMIAQMLKEEGGS